MLLAVAAAGCWTAPRTINVVIGNRSGEPATILVISDDQAVSVWLRLPDASRTVIADWPVRGQWASVIVVAEDCTVLSPDPWAAIPVANGDPATGVEIDHHQQALSGNVADLSNLTNVAQARIVNPCPGLALPPGPDR